MDTMEQVTVVRDVPIGAWRAPGGQDTVRAVLRDEAAARAAEAGKVLTPAGRESLVVLYMRFPDGPPGGAPVEVIAERADLVRLRLAVWAKAA
jgi:hypothetical protein